jgi:hypothetical protein
VFAAVAVRLCTSWTPSASRTGTRRSAHLAATHTKRTWQSLSPSYALLQARNASHGTSCYVCCRCCATACQAAAPCRRSALRLCPASCCAMRITTCHHIQYSHPQHLAAISTQCHRTRRCDARRLISMHGQQCQPPWRTTPHPVQSRHARQHQPALNTYPPCPSSRIAPLLCPAACSGARQRHGGVPAVQPRCRHVPAAAAGVQAAATGGHHRHIRRRQHSLHATCTGAWCMYFVKVVCSARTLYHTHTWRRGSTWRLRYSRCTILYFN